MTFGRTSIGLCIGAGLEIDWAPSLDDWCASKRVSSPKRNCWSVTMILVHQKWMFFMVLREFYWKISPKGKRKLQKICPLIISPSSSSRLLHFFPFFSNLDWHLTSYEAQWAKLILIGAAGSQKSIVCQRRFLPWMRCEIGTLTANFSAMYTKAMQSHLAAEKCIFFKLDDRQIWPAILIKKLYICHWQTSLYKLG